MDDMDNTESRPKASCSMLASLFLIGLILLILSRMVDGVVSGGLSIVGGALAIVPFIEVIWRSISAFIEAIRAGDT
jgi:hypothetical protein